MTNSNISVEALHETISYLTNDQVREMVEEKVIQIIDAGLLPGIDGKFIPLILFPIYSEDKNKNPFLKANFFIEISLTQISSPVGEEVYSSRKDISSREFENTSKMHRLSKTIVSSYRQYFIKNRAEVFSISIHGLAIKEPDLAIDYWHQCGDSPKIDDEDIEIGLMKVLLDGNTLKYDFLIEIDEEIVYQDPELSHSDQFPGTNRLRAEPQTIELISGRQFLIKLIEDQDWINNFDKVKASLAFRRFVRIKDTINGNERRIDKFMVTVGDLMTQVKEIQSQNEKYRNEILESWKKFVND